MKSSIEMIHQVIAMQEKEAEKKNFILEGSNYYTSELRRLGKSKFYRLLLSTDEGTKTKYMNISPDTFYKIMDILKDIDTKY